MLSLLVSLIPDPSPEGRRETFPSPFGRGVRGAERSGREG